MSPPPRWNQQQLLQSQQQSTNEPAAQGAAAAVVAAFAAAPPGPSAVAVGNAAAVANAAAAPAPARFLLQQQQQHRASRAPDPAPPSSDLDRLIDRRSKRANATEATLSKLRAERASLAEQLLRLQATELARARDDLSAARARLSRAAAAEACLEQNLGAQREQVDELRKHSASLTGRCDAAGKLLREEAAKHAAALAGELAAKVKEATRQAGGGFLSDE